MSRSSLLYGPFSIVWGFGAVILTALLYRYRTAGTASCLYVYLFGRGL